MHPIVKSTQYVRNTLQQVAKQLAQKVPVDVSHDTRKHTAWNLQLVACMAAEMQLAGCLEVCNMYVSTVPDPLSLIHTICSDSIKHAHIQKCYYGLPSKE